MEGHVQLRHSAGPGRRRGGAVVAGKMPGLEAIAAEEYESEYDATQ